MHLQSYFYSSIILNFEELFSTHCIILFITSDWDQVQK
jgi:hypothetical protein